jgi:fibro-slime domain-containing protein
LDGSASTDVDGDVLTYKWRVVSEPTGSAAQVVNYTTVKPTITLDKYGVYTIELVVNDGIVDSDPDTVVINTNNARPIANAGPDQSVTVSELALLNGTGSSDPEAAKLTYTWTIVSKPIGSTTTLVNPNEDMPQLNIDKAGSYVVQLVVNDGIENSEPDTVVLNTKNLKPIAVAGKTQTVYVGDKVSLDGSASSDPEGDKLTYRWSFTNKPITTNTRLSSTTAIAPQFDADVEGTYVVQLIVNDGALNSNPDTVTINVEQVSCDTTSDTKRTIPVTIRDFDKSHPDFEKFDGVELGIVKENLGSDGLPVYAKQSGGTKTTSGAANFNQWYRDVTGININIPKTLQMSREAGKTVWSYTNDNFFPIDGLGYGNMPKPYPDHNFHFTLEGHMEFDYAGGEVFTFKGDDDLWVFINGKLAIDIGGVHGVETRTIKLNDRAAYLGIEKGKKYKFDLFFAERHTYKSNFMFQTNINLECVPHK